MSVKAAYDELLAVIRWIDAHSHAVDYPPGPGPMIVRDPLTTFFRSRRVEPIVLPHANRQEGGRVDEFTGETRELA
jgi:hypothetical protein